jgi:hypothetical protein
MPYQYDVFFSYKRNEASDPWHLKVLDIIRGHLDFELGRPPAIFVDRESIEPGSLFPERIKDSLRRSRCMVCIWSPSYFQSAWCVTEWLTFRTRAHALKKRLLTAAKYCDGSSFPLDARTTQYLDFSPYALNLKAFWESQDAVEFEKTLLKRVAADLATMINEAPEFDEAFGVTEVTEPALELKPIIRRPADA